VFAYKNAVTSTVCYILERKRQITKHMNNLCSLFSFLVFVTHVAWVKVSVRVMIRVRIRDIGLRRGLG